MKALAIIFDGFEEEEAVAPFALLRRAGVDLAISSNKAYVTGAHNIIIKADILISEVQIKDFDCLILPGGPHYKTLKSSPLIHEIIKYYIENNKLVAAICASPTILGGLGYLKNKRYTCFTKMNEDFGGIYTDNGVEQDGMLITAKSVAYSIDFAYKIIEILLGRNSLNKVFNQIYYEK